jgi:PST family polysaccharide transporter
MSSEGIHVVSTDPATGQIPEPVPGGNASSYRQIFKSTAVIGATQVANIGIGVVRNKALAVLLAPAGFGLAGTYLTITGFVGGVTGLGLGMSGVRQIAEAAAGGNQERIARAIKALRWASLLSGLLGMVVLAVLSALLSYSTFGDGKHTWAIALMSLSLLFGGISTGQLALIQGLRRLVDLGKSQVAGAFFGMLASVVIVYFLRQEGVALYLVVNAGMALLFSWWFARKIGVLRIEMRLKEKWLESRGLLALGFAFLLQNVVLGLGAYLSRVLIIHQLGLSAVGLYTAAWTLSNYYVSMVLKAMGADFYPRLTGAASDHPTMNRLVNEQIEMGLLIAVPGVLAVLALAPWVLHLLYSAAFVSATEIIRWQVLGVLLQVVSWPIGTVLLAKAKGKLYVVTEIVSASVGLFSLFAAMRTWKLEGIGISVALTGLIMSIYFWLLGHKLSGFSFSRNCVKVLVPSILVVLLGFISVNMLTPAWGVTMGVLLAVASTLVSIWMLQRLIGINAWQLIKVKLAGRTTNT